MSVGPPCVSVRGHVAWLGTRVQREAEGRDDYDYFNHDFNVVGSLLRKK